MTNVPPSGGEWGEPPAWPPPPPPPPPGTVAPVPGVPPPPYPAYAAPATNGFAVASLVLGILGFTFCLGWVVALVLGYVARHQIDTSGGRQTGRGMATAGIVLGYVWGGLSVLYVVLVVVLSIAT